MPEAGTARAATPEWLDGANLVTELRLLAIPVVLVAVGTGHMGWALGLFLAASVSDGLDGWLARRRQRPSRLGATLDPLADKLLVSALFIALSVVGRMPWTVTILVFIRDLSIATCALVLATATNFRDFRPTWWGKASTTAELCTVVVALYIAVFPQPWAQWLESLGWWIVAGFAVSTGIHYALVAAQRYADFRHLSEQPCPTKSA